MGKKIGNVSSAYASTRQEIIDTAKQYGIDTENVSFERLIELINSS